MKRLEDIPKKTLFKVPDGYFDRLPGVIQARVAEKPAQSVWVKAGRYTLKYAVPAIVLGLVALTLWNGPSRQSTEEILAGIESEQLVAYLEETDINADDILMSLDLEQIEVDAIQEEAFEEIGLDDMDVEALSEEFDSIQQQ